MFPFIFATVTEKVSNPPVSTLDTRIISRSYIITIAGVIIYIWYCLQSILSTGAAAIDMTAVTSILTLTFLFTIGAKKTCGALICTPKNIEISLVLIVKIVGQKELSNWLPEVAYLSENLNAEGRISEKIKCNCRARRLREQHKLR